MIMRFGLAAAVLSLAVYCAPVAIAAQGETSGPAAGKTTTPGAAAQKEASKQSGSAAGAPGVEGKQGAESGSAPNTSGMKSQSKSQQ
nr:hypothetical protein [uncultured Rhodopila sp.]